VSVKSWVHERLLEDQTDSHTAMFMKQRVEIASGCSNAFSFGLVEEAFVPRACGSTGGWHNRLYNGITAGLLAFALQLLAAGHSENYFGICFGPTEAPVVTCYRNKLSTPIAVLRKNLGSAF
jgi:hypothetical protein